MKEKGLVPKRRFGEYEGDSWKTCFFKDSFSYITNNSLSRAKLNYKKGIAKNIHYGDILIKYGEVLNVEKSIVPFISDDEEAKKLLPSSLRDGDIIFADAAEDETVGKCSQLINVNDENIVSGLHTITYRPEIETSLGFLGYYFNSTAYRKQIMGLMQGTKVLAISKSTLEGTSLIIPPTISEQKKISSFFTKIDNLIELCEHKFSKLKNLKQSYLHKMFPQKGSVVPEMRFEGFKENWKLARISDVFRITRGNVLATTKVFEQKSGEFRYPVYSSQTKDDGLMGYYNKYLFENAITWTTDGANAGTVKYRKGKFYCTNVSGVLISNNGFANNMVAEALDSISFKHVSKVGNPKLMNNVMGEIEILLPSVKEQQLIGNFFKNLDDQIDAQERKLNKLREMKKAYLEEMFV